MELKWFPNLFSIEPFPPKLNSHSYMEHLINLISIFDDEFENIKKGIAQLKIGLKFVF